MAAFASRCRFLKVLHKSSEMKCHLVTGTTSSVVEKADSKTKTIKIPYIYPIKYPSDYRLKFPEFLPDPHMNRRNYVREKIERMDMLRRRTVLPIPEFYVGTIMAVTVSDSNAPTKKNRFVGVCIQKLGDGLRANFTLRNIVDNIGVEIMYELYSPIVLEIEVLRLEKRLDDELFYLRDAPPEYSTFSFDMKAEYLRPGAPVPINDIKVILKPLPWHGKWERMGFKGIQDLDLPEDYMKRAQKSEKPWEKYDLMKKYRSEVPLEDQAKIFEEVYEQEKQLEAIRNPKKNIGRRR